MLELLLGILAGVLIGVLLAQRMWRCAPSWSEFDRERLGEQFQQHLLTVAGQVSTFAGQLAGADPLLRARLRRFELGGHR